MRSKALHLHLTPLEVMSVEEFPKSSSPHKIQQLPGGQHLRNFLPNTLFALAVELDVLGGSNEQVKAVGISNMSNPIRGLVKHALSLKE